MRKLTLEKAMGICLELWEWCAETGKAKEDWPGWEEYGGMERDCPLCEYGTQRKGEDERCSICPIRAKYSKGDGLACYRTAYASWNASIRPATMRKYAKLFLAQLQEINNC